MTLFILQCVLSPGRAHVLLHLTPCCVSLWQVLEDTVRLSNLQHIQDLLRQEEFLTTAAAEAAVRERSERAAALDEVHLPFGTAPKASQQLSLMSFGCGIRHMTRCVKAFCMRVAVK